ncbi:family 20 glycosylhydrolase [Burkholderia gladioli]|uniref:family 20 glycosylhydrolase n=1 Tax=Burkholderia gladioli TaxID=28095 RepID=UPI0015602A55|nr:family 20 glycosylhydrolase [Burkholderia gladioli]MDN7721141.1 family 20 glycosylhydrolase [Burkholderia gladioli]NRF82629.1 family 20 glycosylhydrolase [Burkholderia gladioli]
MNRTCLSMVLCAVLAACGGESDSSSPGVASALQSIIPAASSTRSLACGTADMATPVANGNAAPAVVPGIRNWTGGAGSWQLDASSRIVLEEGNATAMLPVANRLKVDLLEITGLSLPITTGASVQPNDIGLSLTPCSAAISTQIGKEGYTLSARDGLILRANPSQGLGNGTNGLFYATRTLVQMLELDGRAAGHHASVPLGDALDAPLYGERAVLIDVGRQFVKKESLEAYMKFMGWYKLNTLHLVISGDLLNRTPGPNTVANANFRLHSSDPAFKNPPLSTDGLYYSKADWDEMEAVAADNGISIVPELDVPGHSQSMARAFDPGSTGEGLDLSNPGTLPYVERVWDEFLPWFRSSKVHIGGDESGNSAAIRTFLNSLAVYLQGKGKTVEMWQDTVSGNASYNPDIVIQNWADAGPLAWTSPKFPWIDASGSFYVAPNNGAPYEESLGFAGDSFYADDSALGISHPAGEAWDWFGNVRALSGTAGYAPLGGQISLWADLMFHHPYAFEGLAHYLFSDTVPAAGQIWWNGQKQDSRGKLVPYSTLRESVARFQFGPGTADVPMFQAYPLSASAPSFSNPPAYRVTPDYPARDGVLSGLATKYDCDSCGAGEVGYLGTYAGGSGSVTITVPVVAAGTYMLPIYYLSGNSSSFDGQLNINGAASIGIHYPATGGSNQQVAEMGTFVALQAGPNTIRFSSTAAMGNIAGLGTPILQP